MLIIVIEAALLLFIIIGVVVGIIKGAQHEVENEQRMEDD